MMYKTYLAQIRKEGSPQCWEHPCLMQGVLVFVLKTKRNNNNNNDNHYDDDDDVDDNEMMMMVMR